MLINASSRVNLLINASSERCQQQLLNYLHNSPFRSWARDFDNAPWDCFGGQVSSATLDGLKPLIYIRDWIAHLLSERLQKLNRKLRPLTPSELSLSLYIYGTLTPSHKSGKK